MTDENLMRAINALKDLIAIAGLPKNQSYFWDEARRKLAELRALRDQRSKHQMTTTSLDILPNPFLAPPATIVRAFSPCGPCLTLGKLTKTTAQFYCYDEWHGGESYHGAKKVRRPDVGGKYSRAHIVPCPSCRDHVATQYPNGYDD